MKHTLMHVKAADHEATRLALLNDIGVDPAWVEMPDGTFIVGFASASPNDRHQAVRMPNVLALPAAHHPTGIAPHVAARFPHVRATEGMSAFELLRKLHAHHHSHPLLDPEA